MKHFLQSITLIALLISFTAASISETSNYAVDTEKSSVNWKGYKVTGSHEGGISVKAGSLDFTDGLLSGGAFEIDMTSMTCTDLPEGPGGKLLGHLRSDDFFGTKTYPTANFKITKCVPQGANRYKVMGDLTIKETTKPIKFITTTTEENGAITASADIKIDRSEFDVKYGSGTFFGNLGDKTIYDEFDLTVNLVASPTK